MQDLEAQLTTIACEHIIFRAAQVYAAELCPATNYKAFAYFGADYILCDESERPVTLAQIIQWEKWCWLGWAACPSDLTLRGCIRFLLQKDVESDDAEDAVSLEQVLAVLKGERMP